MATDSFLKETQQKNLVYQRYESCLAIKSSKLEKLNELEISFQRNSLEPNRLNKQTESIENAVNTMNKEIQTIQKDTEKTLEETKTINDKKNQVEILKKSMDKKIEIHLESIDIKDKELAAVASQLETEKADNNDLITNKVEYNLRKKESENLLRRSLDEQNNHKKKYDMLKRQLKKKRVIADESKQAIPTLENNLVEQNISLKSYRDEKLKLKAELKHLRIDVDSCIVHLLQTEGLERSKKEVDNF